MVHKFVYGKNSARMVKKRAGAKRGIGTLFEIALGCGNLRPSCGKLRSSCAKIALVRFCNIRPIVPKSARFRKSARCNKKCIKTCVEHKFVHEWVLQVQRQREAQEETSSTARSDLDEVDKQSIPAGDVGDVREDARDAGDARDARHVAGGGIMTNSDHNR